MKTMLIVAISLLFGCSSPGSETSPSWKIAEPATESDNAGPLLESPVAQPAEDPILEYDLNGEDYRDVWDVQHRQSVTGERQAPPHGGVGILVRWPKLVEDPHEMPFFPSWMEPTRTEERWLTVSFPNSPDPRPRRFNMVWDKSYMAPNHMYVNPWVKGSYVAEMPMQFSMQLIDLGNESRLPWNEDITEFDEFYVRFDVPSVGHYWERICRRSDQYNTTSPYHHHIICQVEPEDVSPGTEWVQRARGAYP